MGKAKVKLYHEARIKANREKRQQAERDRYIAMMEERDRRYQQEYDPHAEMVRAMISPRLKTSLKFLTKEYFS